MNQLDNQQIIAGINSVRSQHGLSALTESASLDKVASLKANDMCANNYWSHDSPTHTWQYFYQAAGVSFDTAAENLAYGFTTPSDVVTGWANSSEHYTNMMGKYTLVGSANITCATYQGEHNQIIVAVEFSTPYTAPVTHTAPKSITTQPVSAPSKSAQTKKTAPPAHTETTSTSTIVPLAPPVSYVMSSSWPTILILAVIGAVLLEGLYMLGRKLRKGKK